MTEIEQIAFEVVSEVDWHRVVKTMKHNKEDNKEKVDELE
jgi:hypothetical protein